MNDRCDIPVPRCPQGHAAKHVRPNGDRLWYCNVCQMMFDDSGDDGDVGRGSPERYAERKEEYELRQRARRDGRMKLSTDFRRFEQKNLRGGLGR